MICATCGAGVTSIDVHCQFCQTVTPYGQHELMRQKLIAEEEARQHQAHMRQVLEARSQQAAKWTFKGIFTFGLANLYHGLRALWVARQNGLALPGKSRVALIAGVIHVGINSGVISLGFIKNAEYRSRVETVVATLATRSSDEHLERDVACLLFEQKEQQSLLGIVTTAACDGSLLARGDAVLMENVHVERLGIRREVDVCFKRGDTWHVSAVGKNVACGTQANPTSTTVALRKPPPKRSAQPRVATIDVPKPTLRRSLPTPRIDDKSAKQRGREEGRATVPSRPPPKQKTTPKKDGPAKEKQASKKTKKAKGETR